MKTYFAGYPIEFKGEGLYARVNYQWVKVSSYAEIEAAANTGMVNGYQATSVPVQVVTEAEINHFVD